MDNLSAYFMRACGILNWGFLGYQEDIIQKLENPAITDTGRSILAVKPNLFSASKIFLTENEYPTRLEMPLVTEGDTRFLQGTLLLGQKLTFDPSRDYLQYPEDLLYLPKTINEHFRSHYFQDRARIGLGQVLTSVDSDKITHQIGFYISLNNSFEV